MKATFARITLVVIIVIAVVVAFLSFATYSEGTRAGFVIKVSKKGFVFKTWEGQLNLQSFGAANPNNAFAEVFDFSIYRGDTATYTLLQEVSLTGERINLHYEEKYAILPWQGDTRYFVTKIDRIKKPEEQPYRDPYRDNRQ